VLEGLEAVVEVRERVARREETNLRPAAPLRRSDDLQGSNGLAALKANVMLEPVPPDPEIKPVGERVDDGDADAVQAA
jgi:hypothetical protein